MNAADWAEVGGALFAALAALAALRTVKNAEQQNETAREALKAQTQPILASVPRGMFLEHPPERYAAAMNPRDRAEVSVSAFQPDEDTFVCTAQVPVRNVGNGVARLERIVFRTSGGKALGTSDVAVLPAGELTILRLALSEDDDGFAIAEAMATEYADFEADVEFCDAGNRPRGVLTLAVANGQHPRVRSEAWKES